MATPPCQTAALLLGLWVCCVPSITAAEAPRLRSWSEGAERAWWREHAELGQAKAGADRLYAALLQAQQEQGVSRALANRHFLSWLAHLRWLRLLGDADGYFADEGNWKAFRQLSALSGFSRRMTGVLSARDDGGAALRIVCNLERAVPEDLRDYQGLAIAFAVVWDQEFPEAWPHSNVKPGDVPTGDADVVKRFRFYAASHRAKRLAFDPNSLSPRELTFVVDSPVTLKELGYVQQVKLGNISKLEQLYTAVPYDTARISGKRYVWPHGNYRLIDVGKKGGICMDQSYFVAQTGKSQGIPTILFTGQGRSGDHAWVGFLTDRGRWTLDAARWRGENYPIGIAYDPQTWRRISDQQMEFLVKGEADSPSVRRGKQILGWAEMNREDASYPALLREAQRAMPRSFEPWELEEEWLRAKGAEPERRREFWSRWIANFTGERDMKARGQRALLRVLREVGDDPAAERLTRQIVAENRSKRFDLGIAVAADGVFDLCERGDWESAGREFGRVLARFKRDAGGHLFYNLVQPYLRTCIREGRTAQARSGFAEALGVLKPEPGSILANDIDTLRGEIGG